jgi:hypothetical protein
MSSSTDLASLQSEILSLKTQLAALQMRIPAPTPEGSAASVLQRISASQLETQNLAGARWVGSVFQDIEKLKADHSGKVGELFINQVAAAGDMMVEYDGDQNINAGNGTYDVTITGPSGAPKRDELKTARLGVQGSFQHENLHVGSCDQFVFLDIAPACMYLTVLDATHVSQLAVDGAQHPVLGRKPHLRKGTTDVFKLVFSESNLRKAVEAGLSLRILSDTPMQVVADFLKKFH